MNVAVTTNPFRRQATPAETNPANPRRVLPRATITGVGGTPQPANRYDTTMQPVPSYGTPSQSLLQQGNAFANPIPLAGPTPPSLSSLFPTSGVGATSYGPTASAPTTQPPAVQRPPSAAQQYNQQYGGRPQSGYTSGQSGNFFGGQMQGSAGRTQSPEERQAALTGSMVGGMNFGGMGGVPDSQNPYSFGNAYQQTMDRQNSIMGLLTQSRQGLGPAQAQMQSMFLNPQGFGNDALQAQERLGAQANAAAIAAMQQRARNSLGAAGYGDSPVNVWMNEAIGGMGTANDLQRRSDLATADAAMRNQNRQFAGQQLAQLLGLDVNSAAIGANAIGQMQTPYLTPQAAAAAGVGQGGGGGYGSSVAQRPTVNPATGMLYGQGPVMAGNSSAQNAMIQGNARWREQTGQDVNRTYGGKPFFGFSF